METLMAHAAATQIDAGSVTIPAASSWSKLPVVGVAAALIGLGGTFAMGGFHGDGAYAYLTAYLFFFSLAVGALFFVTIHHATRAGWSVVVRRLAEILAMTLPVLALLFVPIALASHDLYHWTHHDVVQADPILKSKEPYLNVPFWLGRAALYFIGLGGLAYFFFKNSTAQDRTGDLALSEKMRARSYPAIPVIALSVTFAAFDWSMSLDPHWFSTMFGVCFFAGGMVAFFATMAILGHSLTASGHLKGVTTEHFHDIGKFLFGFMVFWSYVNFSQFMLIWYANIPEETLWFAHRWIETGWDKVSMALALGHFVIPFFFMMSRHIKRNRTTLLVASGWMLVMHYLDLFWQVMPTIQHHGPHFTAVHALSMLGVGGVCVAMVGVLLRKVPLVPVRDPRLSESLSFQNY
jgi:hypothetical protein